MKVINERNISLAGVRKILEDKEKTYVSADMELFYEQKRALEHARRYAKLSLKDIEELRKKIGELDMGLSEGQVVKICDFLPEDVDDVRAIFAKERFKYSKEDIQKILDLIAGYR